MNSSKRSYYASAFNGSCSWFSKSLAGSATFSLLVGSFLEFFGFLDDAPGFDLSDSNCESLLIGVIVP